MRVVAERYSSQTCSVRRSNRAKPAPLKPETVTSAREPPAAGRRHIMERPTQRMETQMLDRQPSYFEFLMNNRGLRRPVFRSRKDGRPASACPYGSRYAKSLHGWPRIPPRPYPVAAPAGRPDVQ
jgi:hypothetical protein